ncbi:hypothetical protein AMATHDRAFT_78639 [Amanita thiersii Skay4041]|uniref:Rab-GAP TBC domain-containing protein n=1 Tax=Amanita thiersii Skay4041 TaxID=703135 RepID=A0A2A9P064_9AGAR|nr:hypothetical protein AMATHDRAFT_78639 [Amanita thiersii Skay4041]
MNDLLARPQKEEIKRAFEELTKPESSREKLKHAALNGRLHSTPERGANIAGRSIAWKIFLVPGDPLPTTPVSLQAIQETLRDLRGRYISLLLEYMKAPDGSYEESFRPPGLTVPPKKAPKASNINTNNPLSLHEENPWKQWFEAVELRKTILQDVERTFPEIPFFREPAVQTQLSSILFLYSVMNPSIGYRQGMHELLAPLYHAVEYDSVSSPDDDNTSAFEQVCSRTWVAADSWILFDIVMKGVSRWYEWREQAETRTFLSSQIELDASNGQRQLKPYVAPIVQTCNQIQTTMLRTVDPLLWKHMHGIGIEPQIYGIRWLRLLFTREFDMTNAMRLWDGLFASDPSLELVPWICVAMLVRIRNQLIPTDYSGQLAALLHYPCLDSISQPGNVEHTLLLVRQALLIQSSPNPSTGATIVMENRVMLGIPVEVPNTQSPTEGRPSHLPRNKAASTTTSNSVGFGIRQPPSPLHLPELIARGLLERGESLGINKTVMSAVSELKVTIGDMQSEERAVEERPPWEPRTRFEVEREISQIRLNNKRMGEALRWIVDIMLQDENEAADKERLKMQKREALESLSHVRDVLLNHEVKLEEDRLFGEEEMNRRREVERAAAEKSNQQLHVNVAQPAPASVIDSRSHISTSRVVRPRSAPRSFGESVSPERAGNDGTTPPVLAPWNYTPSGFLKSNTNLTGAELPRRPPPTSSGGRQGSMKSEKHEQKSSDVAAQRKEGYWDPLGALG